MAQPSPRHTVTFKVGDVPVPGYRLARELGRGTFGVVWLAVTENGFERALKVVNLEQKGGKKEFRALRLIKDRKILHGNLLTLIDYWLLDRDGTIISTPNSVEVDTHVAAPKAGSSLEPKSMVATERTAKAQITNLASGMQGTMIPGHDPAGEEKFSVRDTFQQRITDTKEEETSQAIWLVVAMELGHKTLHDRQKEYTLDKTALAPTEVSSKGKTHVDKQEGTAAGSNTVADRSPKPQTTEDDELAPLPADEVLPYMEQAARGLDYLHRCEIVHRDVKPQNIMLVGDVAKVCDYGLASELGDIRATTNAFTLPYAAPEAINKNQPLPASDQYSLAVTYVELRTGRWPFISNTSTAVYAAKDTGVHHLKFVPKRSVRTVLKRALSKNPEERFSSCGEFVKQLSKAEATRFSLFATAQAALALLAICTVLLAAAATHPDVRKQITQRVPWFASVAPIPTFDLAEFKSRLAAAEALLKPERHPEALPAFTKLQETLNQLPEQEKSLRVDVILGLARAQAGQVGFSTNPQLKQTVAATLNTIPQPLSIELNERQALRYYYLKEIAIEKQNNPEAVPGSQLAKSSLTDWERQLWTVALVNYESPELANLMDKVVTHRKLDSPEGMATARAAFAELTAQAKLAQEIPTTLRHQIALEEYHLDFHHDQAAHADNLKKIKLFIEQEISLDQNLLDRALLLHLLILDKIRGNESSYFDSDVSAAVADFRPELFDEVRTDSIHFSPAESAYIQQLRARYQDQIRVSTVELPELAFASLKHVFTPHESFQLLAERVRAQLANVDLKDKQLVAIQAVWNDLRKFMGSQYQAETLSAEDAQEALQVEADLSLEVSFADLQAKPDEALKEFVDRVVKSRDGAKWFPRLLARAQQDPVWVKAAVPELQKLVRSPTDDLASNKQFDDWRLRVEGLLLRDVLLADPADATAIQSIMASLKRDTAVEKGPLPSLIKIECEILTSAAVDDTKRRDWDLRIGRAIAALGTSDPDLKAYGNFVHARLFATSSKAVDHERAVDLIAELLKQRPLPTWITSTRRQGAGDIFALAAIKALRLDDNDVLGFADLTPGGSPKLAHFQAMASETGLQAPALQAVAAIVEATQGDKADWTRVRDLAHQARQSPNTVAVFERYQASRLLEYVEALASLRLADAKAPLPMEVINAFYELIMARQMDAYQFYSYAEGSTEKDEGVLQNIVNPVVLRSLLNLENASAQSKEAKERLAFLWGAKGRLLQRSPLIVQVDPAKVSDLRDSTTVALTLSNEAFDRARQLDSNVYYLVGYGRTMVSLPSERNSGTTRLEQIYKLVEEHDPEGKNENLGMRYLFAYMTRFKGYDKNDIPLIVSAETRYESLLKDITIDDPFDLKSPCLEGLSDVHLRLAFLHNKVTTEEVRCVLENRPPSENTKAFHLKLAAQYALEATKIEKRPQKENAFTALGNAHEDFGYYLGLTDHYEQSIGAFHEAIGAARDRGLPEAKAQMNYGRCLYRYGTDPFADFASNDVRVETLSKAVGQLQEASDSGNLIPIDQVESFHWLGVGKRAIAAYADSDKRLVLLEEIAKDFRQAADAAAKLQMTDRQLLSLSYESQTNIELYRVLKAPVRQPQVLERVREIDESAYQVFVANPETANPINVAKLAGQALFAWPGDLQKRNRWLTGNEKIRAQWTSRDAWKFEAFCLRLEYSMTPSGSSELALAKAIVPTIEDVRLRNLAQARLLDFEAGAQYKAFDELAKDIKQETLRVEVEKPLVSMIAAKEFHDQILDPETKALLDRINSVSSTQLRIFARDLTVVEKKRLQDALMRSPSIDFRIKLYRLCNLANISQTTDAKSKATGTARARIAHDAIKPFFVFSDSEHVIPNLRDLKDKHQVGLDKLESQLKQAGQKFDVKPAN